MSNRKAYLFLEQLQAEVYGPLGVPPSLSPTPMDLKIWAEYARTHHSAQSTAEDVRDTEEMFLAEFTKAAVDLPTKYEDPRTFMILNDLVADLTEGAKELGAKSWPTPAIGTLPTGQINALTLAIPEEDQYIVVFERGMFAFALLLSKALVQALPHEATPRGILFSTDSTDVLRTISSNPELVARFAEAVTAYAIYGDPGRARQYSLTEQYHVTTSSIIRDSLELFVLGHEYSHIIGGHLTSAERRLRLLPAMETEADEIVYDWNQEYEADLIGMTLSLAAMRRRRKMDLALSFWGIDLFFSGMDVMDRAVSLLRFGEETRIQLGSHPPNPERRSRLRQALVALFGNSQFASIDQVKGAADQVKGAVKLGQQVEFAIDQLWKAARVSIMKLHADGVRPAKAWEAGERRKE